jgi:hypothetical protein
VHFLHHGQWHWSEENPPYFFLPDHEHQFVHGAVDDDQDEQEDLDGPEMRPNDLCQQFLVAGHKAVGFPREIDEMFQIMEHDRHQEINCRLPGDIVDERFSGKAIDDRQHVGDQDRFAQNQGGDENRNRSQRRNRGSPEHQHANYCHDVQSDKKVYCRREDRNKLLLELLE